MFYPEGTVFTCLIYWVHHNPEYYPNPDTFDPDRFTAENSNNRPHFTYIPFSAGPRNCVGMYMYLLYYELINNNSKYALE